MLDIYAVIAEPSRRRMLDRLLTADRSVAELTEDLGMSQPLVSKHLKTLRQSGLVKVKAEGQRRIYSLNAGPLADIDDWLSAYRSKWNRHVDALERHLDRKKKEREEQGK